jgi:ABC-2 type transport system ATP-binding protein
MLRLRNLSKQYWPSKSWAIHGVSLDLDRGEIVGLVGLNGAGKTTTLRLAAGVSKPSTGQVLVENFDLRAEKARASRLIGWVPEASTHDESAHVGALISYYAAIAGMNDEGARQGLIERWGLAPYANRPVRTLSLGMLRRLSIIASELTSPRYLLLDEVFNGIDPEGVIEVRSWIIGLRAAGRGVLLSSHNLRELASIADRVAVLHKGCLLRILERSEYQNRSPHALRIKSDNLDNRGLEILERFGTVTLSREGATVAGEDLNPSSVNQELVAAGYHLSGLEPESDPLEDLFVSILKEAA